MSDPTIERTLRRYFPFGFPLTLEAMVRFEILPLVADTSPEPGDESVLEVRQLVHLVNRKRALHTYHPKPLRAEDLFALGLITDALRYVALFYCHREQPGVLARGRRRGVARIGEPSVENVATVFTRLLPPHEVIRRTTPDGAPGPAVERAVETIRETADYLTRSAEGVPNRDAADIETVLLSLTAQNAATEPLRELFDDARLQQEAPYLPYVVGLEEFFEEQPPFRPLGETLFRCLRAPMLASPHSLEGQLRYIRERWAHFLPRRILDRITLALDIWEEDRRLRGLGPGAIPVPTFGLGRAGLGEPEFEAFSTDRDWMSNVVLIAKNVHVWLDQLSKIYGRSLHTLSDIPDEELDRLARWGFRGLWLIGIWERSRASRKIKQYMGNPEAVASAYSLHDYRVADDLGGDGSWRNLRDRAWMRGIRLASDMVPNHMGIDSRWVIEHPHWFIQLDYPPYPWYTFGGGSLSDDARVGLYIEDGYWERRDAAVVFKRVDHHTGETRYIYHGNDGTSMPWNDTAQLNYLLPEVREAVIRTILHVARHFPIIRFDAAMTLAKRHYQRLWFPQPGDAGAIPSRAERGMSKEEFDRAFPAEFWREVVDRVAAEAPDTLLLAEAFWLMEGFFVRTLGMHRVYNSAFMNMLKMEENAKYRQTVKNVLEFSPEVLKRFVNFMNNPDERTAVEQFGKGDKYIGVCLLMVTMPGLPMFGHGQIEGFTEKYGMEYRRAYWDEPVDEHLVRRHEAEIFPLMRRRRLFSGAENFALFDFVRPGGGVDENVFAYSNRAENDRALILYNNVYEGTAGTVHTSTAINVGNADSPRLLRRSLAEALALDSSEGCYYAFRDHRTGLEYFRSGKEIAERGLFAELAGYQWHAFVDWRAVRDADGRWGELDRRLGGRPVESIETARREMDLEPILAPYGRVLRAAIALAAEPREAVRAAELERELPRFLTAAAAFSSSSGADPGKPSVAENAARNASSEVALLIHPERIFAEPGPQRGAGGWIEAERDWRNSSSLLRSLLLSVALRAAGSSAEPESAGSPAGARQPLSSLIKDWLLDRKATAAFAGPAGDAGAARIEALLAEIAAVWGDDWAREASRTASGAFLSDLFADPAALECLAVHEHAGVFYFNKERFEDLARALAPAALLSVRRAGRLDERSVRRIFDAGDRLLAAAEACGYRVAGMLERSEG